MGIPGCEPLGTTGGRRLPDGMRVYAIGDVHGRADLLRAAFGRIDAHRAAHPVPRAVDLLLGDLVDRGSQSRGVIDAVLDRGETVELVALSGNHEEMVLQFVRKPEMLDFWGRNGGYETLISYGVRPVMRTNDRAALSGVRDGFLAALGDRHLSFLGNRPVSFAAGEVFFVHAGVKPGIPLSAQRREDMLWIRDEFVGSTADFGAFVVHGHTPVAAPDLRPNRVNIDTGAYITNRLTCLVVEGDRLALL